MSGPIFEGPARGRRAGPLYLAACCVAIMALAVSPAAAPAAPPANDARDAATALSPPTSVDGATTESSLEAEESPEIYGADVSGTVWYRFSVDRARRVVIRLTAAGDLDAALQVLRRSRSQFVPEAAATTDEDGRAFIYVEARAGAQYLIRVGQRANSVPGTFELELLVPELPPPPPGAPLPASGASGSVDPLGNTADAWSSTLRPGVTYRVRLTNLSKRALRLGLYRPGTRSFLEDSPVKRSGAYFLFTPGPGAGGRYSFLVSATGVRGRQPYRLRIGRAAPDDMWPGEVLRNFAPLRRSFSSDSLDVVDTYRFDVIDRSSVTLAVRTAASNGYALRLLRSGGRRVAAMTGQSGSTSLKRTLEEGRYVVVVQGRRGASGSYVLRRAARTITRLSMEGPGAEPLAPGSSVSLRLQLTPDTSGPAVVTIERFDPLTGWHYFRTMRTSISGGSGAVAFRPPTIGKWRARAVFKGTRSAEASATRNDVEFTLSPPLSP